MTLPPPIGPRIRQYREAQWPEMLQKDLSARMQALGYDHLARERINEIENGKRKVRSDELVGFARVFDIPITELLGVPDYIPH